MIHVWTEKIPNVTAYAAAHINDLQNKKLDSYDVGAYASFAAAVAAIGATAARLWINSSTAVTTTVVLPATLELCFMYGGELAIANGVTVTVNGPISAGHFKIFTCTGTGAVVLGAYAATLVYPQWWGADGTGAAYSWAAFQAMLTAVPANQKIYIPGGQYDIGATLTLPSAKRLSIIGAGLNSTALYFNPTVNDDTLISTVDQDNVLFQDLSLTCSNTGSKSGLVGIDLPAGSSAFKFIRVNFYGWNKYAVKMDSATYHEFWGCRFHSNENSAFNTALAVAVYSTTYANAILFNGCRFAENDQCFNINTSGAGFDITACKFEENGNSGNTFGFTAQLLFEGVRGLVIDGATYFEGNLCGDTDAVIRFVSCPGAIVEGNKFSGESGVSVVSESFIYLYDSPRTRIANNHFAEINDYVVRFFGTSSAFLENNTYINGGVEKTAYADIMALMSSPSLVQLDVPVAFTWDPGNLIDGTGETSGDIAVLGLTAGDMVLVGAPYDLQGIIHSGYFHDTNVAHIRLQNETTGAIDLGSGSWKLKIFKNL